MKKVQKRDSARSGNNEVVKGIDKNPATLALPIHFTINKERM